jgi:hypothetical protein
MKKKKKQKNVKSSRLNKLVDDLLDEFDPYEKYTKQLKEREVNEFLDQIITESSERKPVPKHNFLSTKPTKELDLSYKNQNNKSKDQFLTTEYISCLTYDKNTQKQKQ